VTEPAKPPKAAPAPDMIPVRAPDGSIGTVPKSQLAQAIDAGAQVVDGETLRQAELQVKHGGVGGVALAGAAGAARGLTLGLSDAAAVAIGGDETRQTLSELKEANPYASIGGEVVGALAPAFFSGGATAGASAAAEGLSVGRAIRGLGALPRGVSALGGLAERGVARMAGESLAGRVVSRAAAGAVEGGIYGAGSAVSEAALGDHELTAEGLVGSMEHGVIAGGLLGGAGGLLSRRAAQATERDLELVAGRQFGESAPGLAKMARETGKLDDAVTSYVNRVADSPEQAELLANAWRSREQAFSRHEDTLENATRKVTEHLDTAIKAERAVDMVSFGEAKAQQMSKLVKANNWRGARDIGLKVWEDAQGVINELSADVTKGGSPLAVNRAAKWLEKFGSSLGEISTAKDKSKVAAEIFSQLDDFKRAMGQGAQFGKGPFGLTESAREFDSLYHRVRGALENEEVWGKAGAAQREVNAATQARLATRREFGSTFTKEYGSEAGRPTYVANPEGAASYVRSLTSAKNDLKHRALEDYITNEERFLDAVEKHYAVAPAEKAQIAEARKSFAALRSTIGDTAKEVTTVNQLKRLKAEEQAAGVGGLLGLATDTATRPLKTLERLAEIEKTARSIDNTLRKGVRTFFGREKVLPPAPSKETAAEEFKRVSKQVKDVMASTDGGADNIATRAQGIVGEAPNTAAHVSTVATRAATFLASKLPAERVDPNSLTPHLEQPRVTDEERDKFLRYARATNKPTSVVEDLAAGRVSREGVEAMRVVYPKLYDQASQKVRGELERRKEPLDYQRELQLRIFLGAPLVDPSLFKKIQGSFGQQREAKKQRASAVPNFKSYDIQSASERIEAR